MWSWLDSVNEIPTGEWQALLARQACPSPFLAADFLLPWYAWFVPPETVQRVGLWRRDGQLCGIIALYGEEGGLTLAGGQEVADRLDALVEPGAESHFWQGFFAQAQSWQCPIRFPNLAENSPLLRWIGQQNQAQFWEVEQTDSSPYVTLPQSFEEFLSLLSKKQRHEVRRKMRRAHENIPLVRYRSIVAARDWDIWLPRFFTLHRLSHPSKDSFMNERMENFFREMSQRFAARAQMRIGFLLLEDEPIASMMQFDYAGKLHLYNSGYDPEYAQLSPGVVLLAHCIQDAIRDRRYEYDFLRGTERYKYDLGGRDRGVFRVDYRP